MYYRGRTISRFGKAQPATAQPFSMPSSSGGINSLDNLMLMAPADCLVCHNLMPAEYGMQLRRGYTEWANNTSTDPGVIINPVNTLIGFAGQQDNASAKKLWAVTEEGLWNVTNSGTTAPVQDVVFTPPPGIPGGGFGTYIEVTNDANRRFLQYADEANGLWQYSEQFGTWESPATLAATITGLDPADVAFVTNWKNRIWYVLRNSGDAYYLAPGAIAGAASKFVFGAKFQHGGELKALYSWTVDGGIGVDDLLIAVSRGGDVLVYKGSDPGSVDNFALVGSWYVGELPESRRIGLAVGGELYLLSTGGIINCRDLLKGVETTEAANTYSPTAKISRYLRPVMTQFKSSRVWNMAIYPADGFLQIIAPYSFDNAQTQYCQNLLTKAWGLWDGVPVNCAVSWNGKYLIGAPDGRVWDYDGVLDGTELPGEGALVGGPVQFDVLTSFQPIAEGYALNCTVGMLRAVGVTQGELNLKLEAVYDYQFPYSTVPPPIVPTLFGALWDVALWDDAEWPGGNTSRSVTQGASGIGRVVAISMSGSASSRVTFAGWNGIYRKGGFL